MEEVQEERLSLGQQLPELESTHRKMTSEPLYVVEDTQDLQELLQSLRQQLRLLKTEQERTAATRTCRIGRVLGQPMKLESNPNCRHQWIGPSECGPISKGFCLKCYDVREYSKTE